MLTEYSTVFTLHPSALSADLNDSSLNTHAKIKSFVLHRHKLTFHDFPVGRVCRGITLKNNNYSLRVGDYPTEDHHSDSYLNGPCIGASSV